MILVVSYRQVIRAYPQGGGAYMVSRDNLGPFFASLCGAALLIDYVLTVAVSVSAGTAALASAVEAIGGWRVELSVAFILLLMWGNLRGIREAGRIFAIPTYVYILGLGGVVVEGMWRTMVGSIGPIHYSAAQAAQVAGADQAMLAPVSLFLILHAFAAGTTALTGVEAIADGVPAFRKPEAKNAQQTLLVMALIMAFLFLGITFLAGQLDARPYESGNPTLVAQIARHVLGPGIGALVTFIVLCVIIITKFHHGAWMVVAAVPVILFLLDRTRRTYAAELSELKVEVSQRLAPPKPRHEVLVLLEDLDRAAIGALQYARQLNPLHITAIHIALDPDHARRLAALWARMNLPVALEVVDCSDRNLLACAQQTVAEFVRPDTEVTVLVPKRGYAKFWHRVLHDRSSAGLFKVLGNVDGVNVVIVPFRLGRRRILRAVVDQPVPASRSRQPT